MTKDEAIAKVLETALNGLQKTGEFVMEQAPDLVQQLIAYNTAVYAVWLGLGLLLLIFGSAMGRLSYVKLRDGGDEGWIFLGIFVGGGSFIGGAVALLTNLNNLLKITLAPKVWLLEYAASLVRQAT